MSNDDDKFGFSDKTSDPKKRPAAPPPRRADEVAGSGPGTIRQDGPPAWMDEDDDEGEKTAALDLSELGVLGPDGTLQDPYEEKTAIGQPAFVEEEEPAERTMALDAGAIQAHHARHTPGGASDQPQAPPPAAGPGRPGPEADAWEEKTELAASPFEEEAEEKTQLAASPFEEPEEKTELAASPYEEPEEKTQLASSPYESHQEEERTMLADAPSVETGGEQGFDPSEDRTRVAAYPDLPKDLPGDGESTMMFDASELLAKREAGPQGVVTILQGNDAGKEFFLRDEVTVVGRGLDCDMVLNDPSVSRKHFRIERRLDQYALVDLGSGNGTKVDGTRVSEQVLEDGARIELGTSVLGFGFVGSDKRAPVDVHVEVRKAGAGLKVMFGLLLLLALGAGVVFLGEQMGWWRVVTPEPTAVAAATEPEGPSEAEAAIDEVFEHLSKRKLDAAAGALDVAEEKGANEALVAQLRGRIEAARGHKELIAAQEKAIEAEQYREVLRALSVVPTTSPYYTEADRLRDRARRRLIEGWKDKAYELRGEGKNAEALKLLELVLAENPDDGEARAAIEELKDEPAVAVAETQPAETNPEEAKPEEAKPEEAEAQPAEVAEAKSEEAQPAAIAEAKPEEAQPAEVAEAKPEEAKPEEAKPAEVAEAKPAEAKPEEPKPARPKPEYERANLRRGYKYYSAKEFDKAEGHFERISRDRKYRPRDRKRAQALADRVSAFAQAYQTAMGSMKAFQPTQAIPALEKARKLDKGITGAFGGELSRNLAQAYAFRAAGAFNAAQYKQAAKLARKALIHNEGESSAQVILRKVQGKTTGLIAQARDAYSRGDYRSAEQLAKQVMAILGSKDPAYQEANRIMKDAVTARAREEDD